MSDKFKCVECGQNEVDAEDDICDECLADHEDNYSNED